MTLSLRRKRLTTARTIRPSTASTKRQHSASILITAFLFGGLWANVADAQSPSPISANHANTVAGQTNATWFPPVHVAPGRSDAQSAKSSQQLSPNQLYPGVFDPAPPAQAAGGRFTDSFDSGNRRVPEDRTVRPATRGQGQPAPLPGLPLTNSTGANRQRQAPPSAGSPSQQRVLTRPVAYQQEAVPGRNQPSRLDDVQPAFVAETGPGAIPPEPIEYPVARVPTSGQFGTSRGEFTRAPRAPVADAGLSAEFEALEQPLDGFGEAAQPQEGATGNWRSSGSANQPQGSQDLSVLDVPSNSAAWQTAPGQRPLPARPAAAPRLNAPALDSSSLSSENSEPDWSSSSPPGSRSSTPEATDRESWQDFDNLPRPQKTLSCDELRDKLLTEPLTDIALDVSPPLPDRGAIPQLPSGDWVDHNGQLLARGQMVALSRGYVIVDTAEGRRKISVARLGDSSLALVAQAWQLPGECAIGIGEYAGRCWTPQLSTWYASNLCHKPLYFEQVQLERYGHSAGPFMGPIRSSAHFFGSLVLWPYHTAIHPANECIYPLGYYRPGNCAPWLVEPFPFSAGGAIRQGGVITGAAFLF